MQLKHLALFVDVVNQFMVTDFKNPNIKKLVKKEFNSWLQLSYNLVKSYKKYMDDEEIEDFEDRVACIYEISKVALNLPKEELINIMETFKKLNNVMGNK